MGPPLRSGGDGCRIEGIVSPDSPRFNGAAASQRRRRKLLAVQPEVFHSFNGAAASQRRRRELQPPQRLGDGCFNGAAASQRRRRGLRDDDPHPTLRASMGPPLRSGGDFANSITTAVLTAASMGPPLRSGGDFGDSIAAAVLTVASMGPPLRSGGDLRRSRLQPPAIARFNGAAASQRRRP